MKGVDKYDEYYFDFKDATLPEPYRAGYTFEGWYENGNLVEKIEITEDNIGNRIFYAKWEENVVEP